MKGFVNFSVMCIYHSRSPPLPRSVSIDSIVAVSDQAKKEISYAYKINPKRIDVIYPGADDKWSSVKIKNFSQIPKTKRIIRVIGRWQKYKNIHTISRMLKNANSKDLKGLYFIFIGKKIE